MIAPSVGVLFGHVTLPSDFSSCHTRTFNNSIIAQISLLANFAFALHFCHVRAYSFTKFPPWINDNSTRVSCHVDTF